MMIICDVLIVTRMASQNSSYNFIVSAMCPVFHIHVAVINAKIPAAYKIIQSNMFSLQTFSPSNANYLQRARNVIAVIMLLCIVFMLFVFVIFAPLVAPAQVRHAKLAAVHLFISARLMAAFYLIYPVCTDFGSATLAFTPAEYSTSFTPWG